MKPDYRRIIAAAAEERRDLFISTARRIGIAEQNVEKDFWVCWTLEALFEGRPRGAPRLLFKGGTSLTKAFKLIERFSEDIDITLFRQDLGEPVSIDELEAMTGKKRRAKLDDIRAACQQYLADDLQPQLVDRFKEATAGQEGDIVIDDADPDGQTVLVHYPSVFAVDRYIRPAVRIECGAKSALDPHGTVGLEPYVATDAEEFDLAVENVTTILPERTFWDKVVILHGLRAWFDRRAELRQEGQRVSRHYYDLHAILPTNVGERAVADRALGRECVRHAMMFFGRPDFDLESAAGGRFALTPHNEMLDRLRRDYDAMAGMVFGRVPSFDAVIAAIAALESQLLQAS